jgi:hypothetical protein
MGWPESGILQAKDQVATSYDTAFAAHGGTPGKGGSNSSCQFSLQSEVCSISLKDRLGAVETLAKAHQRQGNSSLRLE